MLIDEYSIEVTLINKIMGETEEQYPLNVTIENNWCALFSSSPYVRQKVRQVRKNPVVFPLQFIDGALWINKK